MHPLNAYKNKFRNLLRTLEQRYLGTETYLELIWLECHTLMLQKLTYLPLRGLRNPANRQEVDIPCKLVNHNIRRVPWDTRRFDIATSRPNA